MNKLAKDESRALGHARVLRVPVLPVVDGQMSKGNDDWVVES